MTESAKQRPEGHDSYGQKTVALKLLGLISRVQDAKMVRESRRAARGYRREAVKHAENSVDYARLMLSAGQAYINGRKPKQAIASLEAAETGVENQKLQGTQFGFLGLARLYSVLGYVYGLTEQPELRDAVRAKEKSLANEIEAHFGIHTEFLDDGTRIISHAASRPSAAPEPVLE